jgi:hypothetical protein
LLHVPPYGEPMPLPPLYKYLDVQGAKLTLQNRTFKHAKPSTYNDTEDLTASALFPEDDETALKQIEAGFVDLLLEHINDRPTCLSPKIRLQVALLLAMLKSNPGAAEIIKQEMGKGEGLRYFDLEHMKNRNRDFVAEINLQRQNWRIFCVSTLNTSERMWNEYAEFHTGIALRIIPNVQKDSKFQLFRPVVYRERRPPLFASARVFQEGMLFGNQAARIREVIDTIIYSKTMKWAHESEYRLAVPLGFGEKDWNTLSYHPEEITELYLGAKISEELRTEIVNLAKAVNPEIKIFQIAQDADDKLYFKPH